MRIIALVIALCLISGVCYAWNTPIYGNDGDYKGYANNSNSNQTTYYDKNGNYSGYSWNR